MILEHALLEVRPGTYLPLVEGETLQDHSEGFRGSPGYQEWGRLLHHFHDPFPTVQHPTPLTSSAGS